MLEGKRISELETVTNLQQGCCFPVLSTGATKRITFGSLLSEIENNLPETGIEQVKEDVEQLKVKTEKIDTLSVDVENVKEEVADIDEMVQGQNATIRNCVSTVNDLEETIAQTHFDDVLELEGQVRANTSGVNNINAKIPAQASEENKLADSAAVERKLDKTTSSENAGKAVVVDEDGNLVFGAAGVQVSQEEGNAIEEKPDGIYVSEAASGSSPIGTILSFAGTNIPAGFLLCDGRELLIDDYEKLYEVIGELPACQSENEGYFKLPDLRESTIVGIGENTTKTIASHDVYNLGEFKDDQLQGHIHHSQSNIDYNTSSQNSSSMYAHALRNNWGTMNDTARQTYLTDNAHGTPRIGSTTHGKQTGFNYIIKATSTSDSIDDIIDDSTTDVGHGWSGAKVAAEIEAKHKYSTEETVVGEWIDGKPIYRKAIVLSSTLILTSGNWGDISELSSGKERLITVKGLQANGTIWNCNSSMDSTYIKLQGECRIDTVILEYTKTTDTPLALTRSTSSVTPLSTKSNVSPNSNFITQEEAIELIKQYINSASDTEVNNIFED